MFKASDREQTTFVPTSEKILKITKKEWDKKIRIQKNIEMYE